MLLTFEGTYRNGKVELAEIPDNIEQADVIVTFLKTEQKTGKSKMITFGQFAGERKTIVNREIIRRGHARVETRETFNFKQQFLRYEALAREATRGLWGIKP